MAEDDGGRRRQERSREKEEDPFLAKHPPRDLKIASEFLNDWLPFLSRDLCSGCARTLSDRIRSLDPEVAGEAEHVNSEKSIASSAPDNDESPENHCDDNCDRHSTGSCKDGADANSLGSWKDGADANSLGSWKDGANEWSEPVPEASTSGFVDESQSPSINTPNPPRMSWADMAQEDELVEEEEQQESDERVVNINASTGDLRISKVVEKPQLSRDQRELIRFMNVRRKKDFICFERVNGKFVNILKGLELHTGIFSAAEQKRIVDHVYALQEMGRKGELKERTYTAPQKWMKGKGRVTIQFGCCYNYATDKNGNPPGILQNEVVDPMPHLLKVIIRRLVRWHVLPPTCVPDSCVVNIYDEGDCIPPHIDNHDFVRPFCTVSFVSECNILFGTNLKAVAAGEFGGPIVIPLPMGSALVLNGNSADVAKHCVPSVPTKRISITFRKMDETKLPIGFVPEPDLQGIQPLPYEVEKGKRLNSPQSERTMRRQPKGKVDNMEGRGSAERYSQSEPHYSARSRRGSANNRRP